MKKTIFTLIIVLTVTCFTVTAQKTSSGEKYGNTLNIGVGIGGYYGYYGYVNHAVPVFSLNYEFGVGRNFTLAPFLIFNSYQQTHYRETVIPIGVKGTYYFDQLLHAKSGWDFYLAGSLGGALAFYTWDADYTGSRDFHHNPRPFFFDFHIGTEYHLSTRLGLFLDLSTGLSTIGLAIH